MTKIILLALLITVASGQSISQNDLVHNNTSKVIMDERKDVIITTARPLTLGEGYQLAIRIPFDEKEVSVELAKGPKRVDQRTVSFSNETKPEERGLYRYQKNVGKTNITLIEVHFKNATRAMDWDQATVDRIWQISEPQVNTQNVINASAANATVPSMPSLPVLSANEWFDKPLPSTIRANIKRPSWRMKKP
jgi:hypothetical protein